MINQDECRHFVHMKDLGDHKAICSRCGYMFLSYSKWVDANLKEHHKNNPDCPDCK